MDQINLDVSNYNKISKYQLIIQNQLRQQKFFLDHKLAVINLTTQSLISLHFISNYYGIIFDILMSDGSTRQY